MMDEHDHDERSRWFPGEYDPQPPFDIVRATLHSMALQADCAVVLRVLLGEYGWTTVRAALEDAVTDNTSGAAVTAVERLMRPIWRSPADGREVSNE
jgi:hypothetical protein